MTLVLATKNRGKVAELRALLAGLPLDVRTLDEIAPHLPPVIEDGATFEENALLKARAVAEATMLVTLADDSGLEVDALGGRPGVRSARFAGDGATDAENNAHLLQALEEVQAEDRRARFRSVIAIVDPFSAGAAPVIAQGSCEGTIAREPRGLGGFGYDPLFLLAGDTRSMAELPEVDKNRVSHRGQAATATVAHLAALVAARLAEAERLLGQG
jgi:XTP/dITP diphosphohydrolase